MNITKMRHQIERADAREAEREHTRRLAEMTLEHRRKHTGPLPGVCLECISAAMNDAARKMNRSVELISTTRRRNLTQSKPGT